MLQTVVELPEFIKQANKCMDRISKETFIHYIAQYPESGAIIENTGGARKVRWTSDHNQGKRGGVRVIYYYHDEDVPIFLFTIYEKKDKDNISQHEKNALKGIIKRLIQIYNEAYHE